MNRVSFFAVLVLVIIGLSPVSASDWLYWRGPDLNGQTKEELPETLPDELEIAWRAEVGIGFSTVTVQGDRVLTMGNREETDSVWCLDAKTGAVIWEHRYPCPLDPLYFEGGPCATPTISDDGKVFTFSRKGHVFCLQLDTGEVVWSRNLVDEYEKALPEWSFSSSPVILENLVILNAGEAGIALDRKTGKTVWKSGPEAGGYASAVPATLGGTPQLLLYTFGHMVGLRPDTGEKIWEIDWESSRGVNAADPLVWGQQALFSSSLGAILLEWPEDGAGSPREIWQNKNLRCYFNAGVLIGGKVYALHGTTHRPTELVCIDWATGETVWSEPGFATGGMIASGNRVIVFDKGELTIFPASEAGFEPELRQQVLSGKCWTAPVMADGRIYCRNAEGKLACVLVEPAGSR